MNRVLRIRLGAQEAARGLHNSLQVVVSGMSHGQITAPCAARLLSRFIELGTTRGLDPELFFPIGTTGPAIGQIGQAKRICQACPVRTSCLGWALRHGISFGIWGGTTEDDRQVLRRALLRR